MYFNPLNKPLVKKDSQNNPPPWNGLNKAIQQHNLSEDLSVVKKLTFNNLEALSLLNLWTKKDDVSFFSEEGIS
jgi:hypothetical protein